VGGNYQGAYETEKQQLQTHSATAHKQLTVLQHAFGSFGASAFLDEKLLVRTAAEVSAGRRVFR